LFICRNTEGVHAHVSECLKGTWERKAWEHLLWKYAHKKFVDPYCECPTMTALVLTFAQKRSMTRNCVMHDWLAGTLL